MILSFVSWWKLYVRTGSLKCHYTIFHIESTFIVMYYTWPACFLHHSFILTNLTDFHFLKDELTYPWIMGCLLVVLLLSLFWVHFITSMTVLLSKKKMEKCCLIFIQFTVLQIKSELFLLSYVGGGFIMPQHAQWTCMFWLVIKWTSMQHIQKI